MKHLKSILLLTAVCLTGCSSNDDSEPKLNGQTPRPMYVEVLGVSRTAAPTTTETLNSFAVHYEGNRYNYIKEGGTWSTGSWPTDVANDQKIDFYADTYTYSVPDGMSCPEVGMRVLVPLARKTITGLVYRVHKTDGAVTPDITLRPIIEVLDVHPVVLPAQLSLWQWIAGYYLCTLGEVMTAALPARLLDNDYRARTEVYVSLHPQYTDPEQLQPVFDALNRAPKQKRLLEYFLELSNAFDGVPHAVEQRQLIEYSGESTAILRTLVEKQILCLSHEPHPFVRSRHRACTPAYRTTTACGAADTSRIRRWQSMPATWRNVQRKNRGLYSPHKSGVGTRQTSALPRAGDSTHHPTYRSAEERVRQATGRLSLAVQ